MDKKFILLMLIPATIIIGLIVFKLFTIITGQEIVLQLARPIDPMDLFRGNYVDLNYAISRLNLNEIKSDYSNFSSNDNIYATLSKKEKFWMIDIVSHSRPSLNKNQICLRGKVTSFNNNFVNVEWGIETFFSPEEQAKEIEKEKWKGNVSSLVVVDSFCNPVLKALIVGNETIKTK